VIEFEGVTKFYKTVIGVNDLTFRLGTGAFGLLGPNGSGKTTLLNLILGQLRPTMGSVKVFGVDPWRDESILRRIGYCPASELLLPNVSAREWVTYQTEMVGFSRTAAAELAERALRDVGLPPAAAERPIGGYSLGMRQRTKLAQAIAHRPDLLILDEPFNGLDPVGRHEMNELLTGYLADGRSVLLASHVLHEVEVIRPEFLLISGGRLLASGSPAEVRRLLIDLPNEIQLQVDDAARVAERLVATGLVDSLKVIDRQHLTVMTRESGKLLEYFPRLAAEGWPVRRLGTLDESLQDLFTMLMRRHRGEI